MIDLCILDFDGCLYPGISKVRVALALSARLCLRPTRLSDWRLLPRVCGAGVSLLGRRLAQRLAGAGSDADLVRSYIHWLAPVPMEYFERAAQAIPRQMYPGALETLAWLEERCALGMISLALQPVLEEVDRQVAARSGRHFAFLQGNSLDPRRLDGPEAVLTSVDKRRHMLAAMERLGCHTPLVIGNDLEDIGLVQAAHEHGGVAIGFRPRPAARLAFDQVVEAPDWRGMVQALSPFFRPE